MIKVTQTISLVNVTRSKLQAAPLKRADGTEGQINTAYIERDNLTLRQELRRLTRKTFGFSKNRRELQHALDFIDAHDNFVKPHRALRLSVLIREAPSLGASNPCHGCADKQSHLDFRRIAMSQVIIINIL